MRYADLGGIEDILQDIQELVEWPLVHPEVQAFTSLMRIMTVKKEIYRIS